MKWIPATFHGQIARERLPIKVGEERIELVYLILAYGKNRIKLGDWAKDLEHGSLIEVSGMVSYLNDTGEFSINGELDFSEPDGFTDPYWRQISIDELVNTITPGFIPGVNYPTFEAIPVLNMRCPVCKAVPGDPCREVGYLVSHRPGEPHCHQARWDRATDAEVWDRPSDALVEMYLQEEGE